MPKASVSVRLDPELDEKLATVAAHLGRPKPWIIEHALREFIGFQLWQLEAVGAGLEDADAGRVVPHEKVIAWVESWGQPDELPMPECE